MRLLDSITDSMDMNLSKLGDTGRQGTWHATSIGSQRVGHDLATEQHLD